MLRLAIAFAVALGLAAAPALAHDNRPPTASFTWSPATPTSSGPVTFAAATADPDGDPVTVRWDLDGDGTFETTGTTASATLTRGGHVVSLRATDSQGASVIVRHTVTVADAAPAGDFTWTPAASGETVHLTAAGVSDADGDPVTASWDFDDDGTYDATGPTAETSFRGPGPHTVALRLSDPSRAAVVVRHTIAIANRPPVATFDAAVGDDGVTLTSRASDPDGGTMQLHDAWDLDGDGSFDDATG